MKKIFILLSFWCCALFARAQTITDFSYYYTGPGANIFCCSNGTWCYNDINCGSGPFTCASFNPSVLDFKVFFSTPNPGGTLGANPFRFKVEVFLNGSTVVASAVLQTSTSWCQPVFYGTPVVTGQYRAQVLFQKRNVFGWVNVGTYQSPVININLCAQPPVYTICGTNVVVTGNTFGNPLTESTTWIQTSGATVIPGGGNVKLDADPVNGYVSLNSGFETQNGATFVAQAFNGCAAGAPQKVNPVKPADEEPAEMVSVFPNPTTGQVYIRSGTGKGVYQLWNSTGVLVTTITIRQKGLTELNISKQPPGVYFLRSDGKTVHRIVKQ